MCPQIIVLMIVLLSDPTKEEKDVIGILSSHTTVTACMTAIKELDLPVETKKKMGCMQVIRADKDGKEIAI